MVEFKSIVVFDAETTSLPQFDGNTTEITELAFLGCEIKHLKSSRKAPRVLHKLVLLFNPGKPISPIATRISELDNKMLENIPNFTEEDAKMLKLFISRLPDPVCIVAHNGKKFDFPILRRKLVKLNTVLGNNVYCADSMIAFQNIYPKAIAHSSRWLSTKGEINLRDIEKTPPEKKPAPENSLHYKNEICHVKRELFPEHDELTNWVRSQNVPYLSCPSNHSLSGIYYFLHQKNFEDAHRAESDSLALLSCIIKCEEFLNWINEHSVIFDNVSPLSEKM